MERLAQYWDELDDLIGIICLKAESLRNFALFVLTMVFFTPLIALGIVLAISEPPLALATVILLSITLMYRKVTNPGHHRMAS